MNDLLAQLEQSSVELLDRPVFGLSDSVLVESVPVIQAVITRLCAAQAIAVREIDSRGIVRQSGARNGSAWLRDKAHVSVREANRVTAFGALVDRRADIAQAVTAGAATVEQVLAIGRVIDDLPAGCDPEIVDKTVAILLEFATHLEPGQLRKLGDRVLGYVAPEVADEQLRRRLDREEKQAARDRVLNLTPDGCGRVRVHGVLDIESAAVLGAAVEPLMTPIPTGPDGPDLRTAGQRRADALIDVCRLALRTGDLPIDGGQPPQLNVTMNIDALRAGIGAGILDTGEELSAATVRRMACAARVLPVVLDGAGVPIDVGRTRRLYSGAARTAVLIRDGGCAFPGCDRPPRWTEIHHIISWIDDGPTDRDNGVALCGFHHRLIHGSEWTVRMGPDRRPEFLAPVSIDPGRTPRRNLYHQRT